MKTSFVWTKETEVGRVVHAAGQTVRGFYRENGFIVLPQIGIGGSKLVVLPDLNYAKIENFWKEVGNLKMEFPIEMNFSMAESIRSKLKLNINYLQLKKIKTEWQLKEDVVWEFLDVVIPRWKEYVNEIEVRMTEFGSIASFFLDRKKLICYVRKDGGVAHITEAILSQLVWETNDREGWRLGWVEVEAMVDFWLINSKLREYFPTYRQTLKAVKENMPDLEEQSRLYLNKLGLGSLGHKFRVDQGNVWVGEKLVDGALSGNEIKILSLLASNRGRVVSYDELMDTVWGEDEAGQLWAINRAMSRLRKKLYHLGLRSDWLKSVYGRGYLVGE